VHLAGLQVESTALCAASAKAQHALDIATEHEFTGLEHKARELLADLSDRTAGRQPRRPSTSASPP
jgi:hypothetical protein